MNPRNFPIYLLITTGIIFAFMTFPILLQGRPMTKDETYVALIWLLGGLTFTSLYISLMLLHLLPTSSKKQNKPEVNHE